MDEFLFIKTKDERKYCYFQNDRQNEHSAFVVVFDIEANSYKLYWWGRKEDKSIISSFHALTYKTSNEWKMIDTKNICTIKNFDRIIKQATKEIEILKKSVKEQI